MLATSTNFGVYYPLGNNATTLSVLSYNSANTSFSDLTNFSGRDWVRQVQLNDTVDDPGITAKVSVQRDLYRLSFSPLLTASRFNAPEAAIFPGRRMLIKTATVPINITPQGSDWVTVADMHVDTMDFSKETMELTCTDRIVAMLRNTYIDTQRVYGSGFVTVESVMQGIIDDNINTPLGYTVGNGKKIIMQLPSGSPGYVIPAPKIEKQGVLDAVTNLANMNGWVIKSKWVVALGAFGLCFFPPIRSNSTSLLILTPFMYDDITQAQISKTDIRNYIYGAYTDATTGLRQKLVVQDITSQSKYGDPPMKMELTEAATSQINSSTQMSTLLNNALTDLKDPLCQYQVSMPYLYAVECGDVYTLAPNSVTHDVAQNAGVTSWSHTIGRNTLQTQLTMRGQPAGLYRKWFAAEARPGVSPSSNMLDPSAPTVTAVANVGTLTVNYTVADQSNWATTEVYISTSSFSQPAQVNGKNQRPTVSLVAKGRLSHFTINGLVPGATYYVGIVVIDRDGNVGTMSNVVSSATQTVGPYHENLQGQQDQLVRNPDLNIYTLGFSAPPDNWILDTYNSSGFSDAWSSGFVDTANAGTGKYDIAFPYSSVARLDFSNIWNGNGFAFLSTFNTGTFFPGSAPYLGHIFYSIPVPIPANEIITATVVLKGNVTGGSGATNLRAAFFYGVADANGVFGGFSGMLVVPTTSYQAFTIPPVALTSGVRKISVGLMVIEPAAGQIMYVDRFYLNRALAAASYSFDFSPGTGAYIWSAGSSCVLFTQAAANGTVGFVLFGAWVQQQRILYPGTYQINANVYGYNTAAGTNNIYLRIDTSPDNSTWTTLAKNGVQSASTVVPFNLSVAVNANLAYGTYIRFVIGGNVAGQVDSTTPAYSTYSITQDTRPDR